MNQNTYPKIFTHRNDHKSQVVIANAEQEAELPPEYLPPVVGVAGQTMTGENRLTEAMLSPEYDALLAEREKLEKDRAEFADLVAAAQKDAAQQHQQLADDRASLTAGYKESMAKLEADRAKLDEDQRLFDAAKAGSQPDTAPADDKAATAAPAPAAGPAKRVRTAKAE
jgi:hypothetical protein